MNTNEKSEETLLQSSDNIEKPKQTTKANTKTAKKETKSTPAKKKKQTVQQEYYYYEPSFFEKVLNFLEEKWYVILCAIGLIVANFVIPAMLENENYQEKAIKYAEAVFNAEEAGDFRECRRLREEIQNYANELTTEERFQFFTTYENTYDKVMTDWAIRERSKSPSW